tara:strand:+ start:364 stop:630 length:267 start_codon:yes stop_codon:yes gene_type:complete
MSNLPIAETPLNQHSLSSLELWLHKLGAQQSDEDKCVWIWSMPAWSAEIKLEQEEMRVTWEKDGLKNQRSFSYGLTRHDVESAMIQGP